MFAAEFFEHFEKGFSESSPSVAIARPSGRAPKWKVQTSVGAVEFKLATDPKGAGLLALLQWPGEFRVTVSWVTGRGKNKKVSLVSMFQYTRPHEVATFTQIMRRALRKFLDAGGPDPYGSLRELLTDDIALPQPNVDTFYYYFDQRDADAYGRWYGSILDAWVERFVAFPESSDDWAWRVLWPHIERKT